MNTRTMRWRLLGGATASLLLLSGCSGGKTATKSEPAPSVSATPAVDDAAVAALAKAVTVSKALRSYSFRAVQKLTGGSTPQTTTLTGQAIRPAALTYTLSVAGKQEQVITVGGRTFVRTPPAAYKALAKPGATVDPLGSLLPLLSNLTTPTLEGNRLTGLVAASVLTDAHLAPAGAAPAGTTPVAFTLSPAGQVSSVALTIQLKAGTQTLSLAETTDFSMFDKVPAIKAPGTVKK